MVEDCRLIIKEARIKLGFSQKQLAGLVNVKDTYISMIETGIRTPSVPLAKKIAKILNIEWTIFFN